MKHVTIYTSTIREQLETQRVSLVSQFISYLESLEQVVVTGPFAPPGNASASSAPPPQAWTEAVVSQKLLDPIEQNKLK